MVRFNGSRLLACVLAVGCATAVGSAQTGPTGGNPGGNGIPAGQVHITNDNLAQFLGDLGPNYTVVEKRDNLTGLRWCELTVKQNGWTFLTDVSVINNNGGLWLISPLHRLPNNPPAAQLLNLLAKNHEIAPVFFSYRAGDRRICMNEEIPNPRLTHEQFRQILNHYFGVIQKTHSLWDSNQWPQQVGK
jgi:hypothetical protein